MTIAVRKHWKFVVKDEFGNAIVNAAVFVYQPGTTNNFLGTAYTTLSGGTTTTNPFTTNSQGEVEAFFDTPQAVDVLVTDNADTAYRTGSSATLSFTSFTENDNIGPGLEGTAGSIGTGDIGSTTSAGTSTLAAAADHRHSNVVRTAVTPTSIIIQSASIGNGTSPAVDNHAHGVASATPVLGYTTATEGSATSLARSDHHHPFANAVGRITQFTPAANLNVQSFHTYTVPANTLTAGSVFRVQGVLYWTNAATVSGLQLQVRLNTTSGNILAQSPTWTSTATTHTDTPVNFDALITVRTLGASGTALGAFWGIEQITVATPTPTAFNSAIKATVIWDTTASNDLLVCGQIQTSNTGINYKVDQVTITQVT